MNLAIEDRAARLNTLVSEGRIIRNNWTGTDEQGRETACLLAALSPEAGNAENADFCPAAVMPRWFAHLTPWLDDASSEAEWPRFVRRYAACAARWSALDEAAWRRVEVVARRVSVVEAMRHTTNEEVLGACRGVLAWLDDDMPEASRAAVTKAAGAAAARAAARAAAVDLDGAWAAAWAAEARAAAWAAGAAAARAAAWAAAVGLDGAWAAEARAAAAAAGAAAAWSAGAAADRITDKILSALEQECGL